MKSRNWTFLLAHLHSGMIIFHIFNMLTCWVSFCGNTCTTGLFRPPSLQKAIIPYNIPFNVIYSSMLNQQHMWTAAGNPTLLPLRYTDIPLPPNENMSWVDVDLHQQGIQRSHAENLKDVKGFHVSSALHVLHYCLPAKHPHAAPNFFLFFF